MEESCDKSESETEVSDVSESYFNDESDAKNIYSVASDELSDNSAVLGGTFKYWFWKQNIT